MSVISKLTLMAAAGGGGEAYWISLLGGYGTLDRGQSVALDSSGNILAAGLTASDGAGGNDGLIIKYDPAGGVLWSRTFGGSNSEALYGIAVDSLDNVVAIGETSSTGAGSRDFLIVKYNSSGTLQWAKSLGSATNDVGYNVHVDSADNILLTGYQQDGGQKIVLYRLSSAGVKLRERKAYFGEGYAVGRNSAGRYVIAGQEFPTSGSKNALLIQYDIYDDIGWQRKLSSGSDDIWRDLAIDASDNIFVVGNTGLPDYQSAMLIAKYNSSGTLQWSRTLGGTGYEEGFGIALDSAGDVVIVGQTTAQGQGQYDFVIAKYNSSGALQWQRLLGGTSSDEGRGLALDAEDNIILVGNSGSGSDYSSEVMVARLPSDGSLTGTYGPFTYQASTLTDAAGTLTSAASSLTEGSTSDLTLSTASLTDAATSLTQELYSL
jgi:uncharacterized delta-60 repeat protein